MEDVKIRGWVKIIGKRNTVFMKMAQGLYPLLPLRGECRADYPE
jgi:hypothetical protein